MSEVVSGLSDGQATAKAVDEVKEGLYMVKVCYERYPFCLLYMFAYSTTDVVK